MDLINVLTTMAGRFNKVVPFNPSEDKLCPLDFTASNPGLTEALLKDTSAFTAYIEQLLKKEQCRYGIGGYNEHRTIYSRSDHFDAGEEPRRLHLGVDIWGKAGTEVYAPLPGTIHSFRFNDHYGDYGATIILQHQLEGIIFHTLYGHLDRLSLEGIAEGDSIAAGQTIAHFGQPADNGHWPPHLHFQLIINMEGMKGDYPGVCRFSEREGYLENCPDGDLVLQMNRFIR